MNEQTLGQRIAAERKKLGLSQEALGEKMGVSRQAISKWESDGAVPEIEKLIAMSKLFGVSLGWLLGVEEANAPQPATLSEEQIALIRQMIPQQPQPRKLYSLIAAGLSAAALVVATMALTIGLNRPAMPDYSQQISDLQSQCRYLQDTVFSLTSRLETMSEANAEVLLLDHTIQFGGIQEDGTGRVQFSAVPKEWLPGQTAALSVLRNGTVVAEVPCTLTGAACTATVDLPLEDGYEYRFVLTYADGSQKFHLLEDAGCCDLKSGTSIQLHGWTISEAICRRTTLEIDNVEVGFSMPYLTAEADHAAWADITYTLSINGQAVEHHSLFKEGHMEEQDRYEQDYSIWFAGLIFYDLKLQNGDQVELTFEASLTTGQSATLTVGSWTYTNGRLTYTN